MSVIIDYGRQSILDTINLLRKIGSVDRWVCCKPYLCWQNTMEKKVAVIFNQIAFVAYVVTIRGESGSSVCSGKCSSNESPGKSLNDGRDTFGLPNPA